MIFWQVNLNLEREREVNTVLQFHLSGTHLFFLNRKKKMFLFTEQESQVCFLQRNSCVACCNSPDSPASSVTPSGLINTLIKTSAPSPSHPSIVCTSVFVLFLQVLHPLHLSLSALLSCLPHQCCFIVPLSLCPHVSSIFTIQSTVLLHPFHTPISQPLHPSLLLLYPPIIFTLHPINPYLHSSAIAAGLSLSKPLSILPSIIPLYTSISSPFFHLPFHQNTSISLFHLTLHHPVSLSIPPFHLFISFLLQINHIPPSRHPFQLPL